MICRILTPNAFEPLKRSVDYVTWREGMVLRDLLPADYAPETTVAYFDGERCHDWDKRIYGSATVLFVAGASDPVTVALVMISVALIAVGTAIARKQSVEEPPAANPDGSSTYGFYGFTNEYSPEGEALPVVYGRMRTAPAVANQIVVGNSVVGGANPSLRENMYLLMVISEGPIYGLGEYVGAVESAADQEALTGTLVNPLGRTNVQVNGISADNFSGNIAWRTGTLNQEPMQGSDGFQDYEQVAASYIIGLTPDVGSTGIDEATKPAGSYAAGSGEITESDPQQYVDQKIEVVSERAIVQIAFEKGQYQQNNGQYSSRSKTVRVQYRETDSGGTASGNFVLLPETVITTTLTSPFVVDLPVTFADPNTYAPAVQNGYAQTNNESNYRLYNTTDAGLELIRPSLSASTSQEWSYVGWVACNDMDLDGDESLANYLWCWSTGSVDRNGGGGHVNGLAWGSAWSVDQSTVGAADRGFSISVFRDVQNTRGNGAEQVYLMLEAWGQNGSLAATGWISGPLGSYTQWGPPASTTWRHVGVKFNGSGSGSQPSIVAFYVDGFPSTTTIAYNVEGAGGPTTSSYNVPNWDKAAHLLIGSHEANLTTDPRYDSRYRLAEVGVHDGLIPDSTIVLLGADGVGEDDDGNKIISIKSLAAADPDWTVAMPLDDGDVSGSFYQNYAQRAGSIIDQANGHVQVANPASVVQTSGGPVWSGNASTAKKSFWQVEVFVSASQTDGTSEKNIATIDQITALDNEPYSYPSAAVANTRLGADEQVQNSRPSVTFDVRGRIIDTWDGSVDGGGDPIITPAWTSNPAWVAADLLTNERYGLGTEFSSADLDWPSFYEWAYFCDEGVADAFGEVSFFGVELNGYATDGETPYLILYVPIADTGGTTVNTIPESWRRARRIGRLNEREVVSSVSITSTLTGGLTDEWVTANDVENGLNQASNQLGIDYITYEDDEAGFHGYNSYAKVYVIWTRLSNGPGSDPIWPGGYTAGQSYFADDVGLTTFGNASGYEPRCRFDGVFDQKEEDAWEAVLDVFSSGRAMPVKAGAKVFAIVDKPRPRVAIFGQGNIVPDTLKVQYTGPLEAPNSLEGDILDEQANYERRTILVDHPSIQDPTAFDSFRKVQVRFRGIVRRSQALRDATKRLNELYLRRKSVQFQVGPDAVNLLPGDRFGLSHDVPQYGTSGRLRRNQVTTNVFPSGGSFYQSWDAQGGVSAATSFALLKEDSGVTLPTGFTTSDKPASLLYTAPVGPQGTSPAYSVGDDGSDSSGGFAPSQFAQHITASNALYPPSEIIAPLDQVTNKGTYQSAFSFYVKEPSLGGAEYVYANVYVFVDENGAPRNDNNLVILRWVAGALTLVSTDPALTAAVTSSGSGWYRVSMVYTASADTGVFNGDYLQARVYAAGTGQSSIWKTIANGGKGVQLLKWADPLSVSFSEWTLNNRTTSGGATGTNAIDNSTTIAPPFYTQTDGTYGYVVTMVKDEGIAFGTTPPTIIQNAALATGGGVATWNGERICLSFYTKVNPANGAGNTTIYTDLREGTATDANGLLSGDGIRSTITTGGGASWSTVSITKYETAGTVNNEAHAVTAVYHNSTTNDANWKRIDVSFDYTPSSGSLTNISLGISIDGGGTGSGGDEAMDVWGIRLHGRGSSSTIVTNRYWHQGALLWGGMYQRSSGSVGSFTTGSSVYLDRDITLEAGNQYELLLRSSFSPDVGLDADATEVVALDGSQVPGAGSSTIAADAAVKVTTPTKFVAREGDLYSFGKTGESHQDFSVQSITLDPETMSRDIVAVQYDEAIYDDTAFGTQGVTTISGSSDGNATNDQAAELGYGWEGLLSTDGGFRFEADLEPVADRKGGVEQRLSATWRWPVGLRKPKAMRLMIAEAWNRGLGTPTPEMRAIAEVPFSDSSAAVVVPDLTEGTTYDLFFQIVGWQGTSAPPRKNPRRQVTASFALRGGQVSAPSLVTTTRGFDQVYELPAQPGQRTYDVVEGRIGGWILGTPGFLIDPDAQDISTDVTLVGQASTPTGRTGMTIHARKRISSGAYGVAQRVDGSEQLKDVGYGSSTSAENDYAVAGTVPVALNVASNVLIWNSGSSALTATYNLDQISLASANRVLANCAVEAYQIRPETLADCRFALGDATGRRWSLEGPMDDLDGSNSAVLLEWRWSSTASTSSETWRVFRPGEVYARTIDFRVTFTRPTSSYDMRCVRILSQALTLPAFEAGDIDGGTF
jgi:hypothetical protein